MFVVSNGNTNKNKCKRNKKASEQDKKASKQNNMRAIRFAFFCTYLRFVKVHFLSKDLSAFKNKKKVKEFIGPEFWNVLIVEFACARRSSYHQLCHLNLIIKKIQCITD